jgi:hypothetical protein
MAKTVNKRDEPKAAESAQPSASSANARTPTVFERRSLLLASLALLVSLSTTAWVEWKDFSKRKGEARKAVLLAYRLGLNIGSAITTMRLAALKKRREVSPSVRILLINAIQGDLDQMDIKFTVRDLTDFVEFRRASIEISNRVVVLYSDRAAYAYSLGIYMAEARELAFWAEYEDALDLASAPDAIKQFTNMNRILKELGVSTSIAIPSVYEPRQVLKELAAVNSAIEQEAK